MATSALSAPEKAQSCETPEELQIEALQERIRRRAHEIWIDRNGQGGSAIEDWIQAEEEIRLETK
jgi:hypothetical protein